ncbi:xanthine dehydrogenase family protein molybdopterin-binding subunit [Halosimplex pelagicum]|uniref:Molybdopterin-dependent oxidoreductase n=1 Tax=Halosimplex pelagicum TaxID=869886 RepID=A0A7D5SUW3_9EURY|nr:molybdopterin cofactor-binding domain-containing protein [Halosimplex pelagicum]QLH81727.1 molybdopterin-dependent oxidoreductase [Halosimplex pelagicum]
MTPGRSEQGAASAVGESAPRKDARAKVRGRARYATDVAYPDALAAGVVRSQVPHAEIARLDTGAAAAMDDVAAVVPRWDLPRGFDDRVRHYGDAVAAVAAETPAAVDAAREAIEYDLDPLESVHDPRESVRADAPLVQDDPAFGQPDRHPVRVDNPDYDRNVDDYHALELGEPDAAFAAADHVHEASYRTPRVTHCNLDRHCAVAEWDGDDLRVTATIGNRGHAEKTLERLFDGSEVAIERPPTAGSSFGGRSLAKLTLEPVAAALAREAGRPVRLEFDRETEFSAAESRHATHLDLKAGATDDGRLTALAVDAVADTGPYPNGVGHVVLSACRGRPLDAYAVDNYRFEGVSAFTNNPPAGEYRGIGVTQVTWALESHLDELARQAGFDPVAFRRENWVAEGDDRPHADAPVSSCGLRECLDRGRARFEELREGDDGGSDGNVVYGWGVAAGGQITTPAAGNNDDYAEARLTLAPDGSLFVRTGAIDVGQGAATALAQIAAEATGLPLDRVTVEGYDPDDPVDDKYGSVANRTTYLVGAAIRDGADALGERLQARGVDGVDELLEPVAVTGRAETDTAPLAYGVHFAEVAVDTGTGAVDVTAYVAAQDVGYAINPTLVEGQIEGAVGHGVEFALTSELRLEGGVPTDATLAGYPVSSPAEMPDRLACEIVESEEASGPYGAKGVGTPSITPVAPAITNAIRDAVGERFTAAPVRDGDVLLALGGGTGGDGGDDGD